MRRFALGAVIGSVTAIAAMYGLVLLPGDPPALVPWVFAVAVATLVMAIQVLGATAGGRKLGWLAWVFGACFLILAGGLTAALLFTNVQAGDRLWLGLPVGAAIVFYVVGLLPMLILPLAYALTFDDARP
jgi:hypothetical protein